eukprot:6223202-Pyramimonas_sp.AAC.3
MSVSSPYIHAAVRSAPCAMRSTVSNSAPRAMQNQRSVITRPVQCNSYETSESALANNRRRLARRGMWLLRQRCCCSPLLLPMWSFIN